MSHSQPIFRLLPFAPFAIACACLVTVAISQTQLAAQSIPFPRQAEANSDSAVENDPIDPVARRNEIQEKLRSLQAELESREDQLKPDAPALLEVDTLAWLDLTYSQIAALEREKSKLDERLGEIHRQQDALTRFGLTDPPPYSWLKLDEIRVQLNQLEERQSALALQETFRDRSLATAVNRLEEAQRMRRQAESDWESPAAEQVRADRRIKLDRAILQCEARQAALDQLKAEIDVRAKEQQVVEAELKLLRSREERVAAQVEFTPQQLDSRMALLDETERELKAKLATRTRELALIRNLESTGPESDPVGSDPAFQGSAQIREIEIDVLTQMLRELVEIRATWRWRFELANGKVSISDIHQWNENLQVVDSRIASLRDSIVSQLDRLRDGLLHLRKNELEPETESEAETPIPSAVESRMPSIPEVNQAIANLNEFLAFTRAGQRLLRRAAEETAEKLHAKDRGAWFEKARYWSAKVWNYELAVVDDRSITVGKILIAIGLLLAGLLLARFFSRLLGSRVLPRLGINPAGSAALQSICYYGLIACFGFAVLELVNVPITGFAFMGGAIAIGVGFGSQNILNNFISGLILLAERPIRIGDLVEIDGLTANIEHIGARSTRVRTGSNLEIVVPNSHLLENNLTNWTLSNNQIRVSVSVGVAYGSPVREVLRHLQETAAQQPQVLDYPEPIILFKEFGDNALLFECHFWVQMKTMMDAERIQSDIRCRIDERLAEAGIVIAFPQRDVHLDTSKPLAIELSGLTPGETLQRRAA